MRFPIGERGTRSFTQAWSRLIELNISLGQHPEVFGGLNGYVSFVWACCFDVSIENGPYGARAAKWVGKGRS